MSGTLPPVAGMANCTSTGGFPADFWYQLGWLMVGLIVGAVAVSPEDSGWLVLLLLCIIALACGIYHLWRIHQMHLCADARDA